MSGYTVARADGTSFQAAGAATTYSDHAVEPGTSYTYTVTAQNEQGTGAPSAVASAGVPPAPSMPAGLSASLEDPSPSDQTATVNLSWTPATVPEADACKTAYPVHGYTVHRHDGAVEEELAELDADATSFTDTGAAFGTSYTYRVSAQSAVGPGETAEINSKTPPRPVGVPKEMTVNISNLDAFDGSITLEWQPPGEGPEVTGYRIIRRAGDEGPAVLAERHEGTSYVDDSVSAAVPYSYTVAARSADNVSADTPAVSLEVPAAVTDLSAAVVNGQIQLAWNPDQTGREVIYRVQRRTGDEEWRDLEGASGLVLAASHTDTAAEPDAVHTYRVQTRTAGIGGSAWTESGPVTIVSLPGAPGSVTAQAEGNDNVITWDAPESAFIDGYRVRHRTGEAQWHVLAEGITSANHRHTGTQADVTHYYGVQAYNAAGDGPWSKTASTGRVTPPLAPSGVTASLEDDDIVLTWTRPSSVHVNGYTVRHRAGASQPFTESERLDGTATSYSVQDIAGDTVYRLMVRAHNDGGDGPWSEQVEIERVLFPTMPTGVSVAADDQNITLTWSEPGTGRVAGYHVSYGAAGSDEQQTVSRRAGEMAFIHTDSAEGTPYQYRVRAHNQAGNGPWSEPVQATRLLAPTAPSGATAAASAGSILVSWTPPDGSIVATYEIEYGVSGSTVRETASVTGAETLFIHTNSLGDTEYQYRVRAVNAAGASGWTEPATAMRIVPPRVPSGVTAAISGNDILVSWTAPTSGFIGGYHLEFRQRDRENWTRRTQEGRATSYTHGSPEPGTTYQYRVRTFNAGGVSNWSRTADAAWYQGAAPPDMIITQPWNTQLLVRWSASTTPGVTGYEVRRRVDGGEWSSETVTATLVFHDWDPDTEDLREYSVRSQKDEQYGDWSAIRRLTIKRPSAVTGVVANRESSNGVRLHWDEPDTGQPLQYVTQYNTGDGNWTRSGISAGYKRTHRFDPQPYGATYTYRVMAVNDVYTNGPATEASQTAVTMPADHRRPTDMPDNLRIKMLDHDRVRLTWDAPADYHTNVTGYRIYRKDITDPSTPLTFGWPETLVPHTGSTETTFIDTTAPTGRLYAYAVGAYRPGSNAGPASHPTYARPW